MRHTPIHRLLLVIICVNTPLHAQSTTNIGTVNAEDNTTAIRIVPDSISPDGRTALYYQLWYPERQDTKAEFYFLNAASPNKLNKLSSNLNSTPRNSQNDDRMLFDLISMYLEEKRTGGVTDGGFCYYVNWSADSKWVSIDGGAHKFEHVIAYQFTNSHFSQVHLPEQSDRLKYYRDHASELLIQEIGIQRKIQNHFIESSDAFWVKNGILAYSTFPTLVYEDVENPPPYFLIDCHSKPMAEIIGFAK